VLELCELESVARRKLSEEVMCNLDAYTQLSYVLPRSSLNLLPKCIESELLKESPELYPSSCNLENAYCTYLWECHPDLPEISIETLEKWNKRNLLYRESLK
jgi:5'-3' exonuclease